LTPDLRIIPFCSFNVIPEFYRDRIQQKYGIPVEQWEKRAGRKLEDGLYRGNLRRGKHHPNCGCDLANYKTTKESLQPSCACATIHSSKTGQAAVSS